MTITQVPKPRVTVPADRLWRALWAGVIALGLFYLMVEVAEPTKTGLVAAWILCALLPPAMMMTIGHRRTAWLFYAMPLATLAALAAFAHGALARGFTALYNGWAAQVGRRAGRMTELLAGESPAPTDVTVFCAALAILLVLLVLSGVRRLQLMVVFPVCLVVVVTAAILNALSPVGFLLVAAGLFAVFMLRLSGRHDEAPKRVLWIRLVLTVLAFALIGSLIPLAARAPQVAMLADAKESITCTAHRLRYGRDPVLPEGDFRRLGSFEPTEDVVLEVVMSEPDSYYLRGFVGSVYAYDRWLPVDRVALYDETDRFYWLHEAGFYGQTQMSRAALTVRPELPERIMTVRNLDASRAYVYAPYEVTNAPDALRPADGLGDDAFVSRGLSGSDFYRFDVLSNQVREYTTTAGLLNEGLDDGEADSVAYLDEEALYNNYVYDTYLEIPSSTYEVLAFLFGEREEGERPDYGRVKQAILSYLTKYFDYSETGTPPTTDFAVEFLQGSREGYSVHFATAATLMFRYFGIPARYVEGYLITPDDVRDALANSAVRLDGTHAHAWTEFYQDGVGWIPFETTPPYLDVMEHAEDMRGLADDKTPPPEEPDEPLQEDPAQEEPDSGRHMLRQRLRKALVITALVIGSLLILLLLLLLIRTVVRRRRLRALYASFETDPPARVILNRFALGARLLLGAALIQRPNDLYTGTFAGEIDDAYAALSARALEAYEATRFGHREPDESASREVRRWLDETEERVRASRTRSQRFVDRFLRVRYL